MSDQANSVQAASAGRQQLSQGMRLYGASARNMWPRLIASATVTTVAWQSIGPVWALSWLAVIWVGLVAGLRLVAAAERAADPIAQRRVTRLTSFNTVVSTLMQAGILVAIWAAGDELARTFAIVATFVGSAYVLLQYYSDLQRFRLLLAPYVATFLYIAFDLSRGANWRVGAVVTCLAAAVSMTNFFFLSRRLLDRSRSALRQARARARDGEQAAESANAAKSTFLATMSHEIRTPLNGVLGMAQAMAGDELSDRQRDRLSVIHRSGEALLAILNDVLDLSKIEAGKLELEQMEFELGEVARGAYSAFTALANKKGLSFALDIESARGRYLGDPTRLRQILYNLISNALKFTEQGEIRVTALRQGEILEISVRDTGVGIPPESLSKLFAKFDQLDSSTTRRFGGTGLGLAICRELAQLMAGEISVTSELGLGSAFTLRVPLKFLGEERAVVTVAETVSEQPAIALRVLAAEDNAVNQLVLKTLLHQMGVDPTVVENGQLALDAWEGGDWDVILMDIQMPVMDGLTATARIRALEAAQGRARTPIVALTANAMSHQIDQYVAAGMNDHVAKPIQAAELFAALTRAAVPPQAKPGGGAHAEVA
ncbi:ATP-binding protein [Phenylobacterium sp.]|uniref:ATP-binding protein n=1 Tax=Phenylobacterium sp. TaxID=1871053 RepID=UPI002B5F5DA5|nr:ATP-binding protein [Phenylobacterium sp.]HLZ74621.1 ATP-binding protein [Phenylobacterium sp.]